MPIFEQSDENICKKKRLMSFNVFSDFNGIVHKIIKKHNTTKWRPTGNQLATDWQPIDTNCPLLL